MTICLVRCPARFLIDERAFPPLGLLAVGAGLKMMGRDVVVYDGEIEDLPLSYPYYGFGPTAPEYPAALDCMAKIRQHNPDAKFVLGGPHATLSAILCLRDGWDCIVVGDGELESRLAFNPSPPKLWATESLSLDAYPMPDRSLVDIKKYRFTLHDKPTTTIMTTRGCPHKCGFCCKNQTNVRLLSVPRVIEEIDELHYRFGYEALAFPEDIFILSRRRTERICAHLKKRGIIWRCLVRADLVVKYGADFLNMMASSGCVGVGVGVESGSDRILRNIQKQETTEVMLQAVDMLRKAKIFTKGFFILGLPGENEESLAETERFLVRARLGDIDVKIFQPYPGSPIYDHKEDYDVQWDDIPLEYTFYKGEPGEYYGNVRTSSLTSERIVEAWKHFEATYKNWERTIEGVMCPS